MGTTERQQSIAWSYFKDQATFSEYLRLAAARARTPREKQFTTELGERALQYGLRTRLTPNQMSWLNTIAKRKARSHGAQNPGGASSQGLSA